MLFLGRAKDGSLWARYVDGQRLRLLDRVNGFDEDDLAVMIGTLCMIAHLRSYDGVMPI